MDDIFDEVVELLKDYVSYSVYEESPLGKAIIDVSDGNLRSYFEGNLVGFKPEYLGLTDFEDLKKVFKSSGYDLIETTDDDGNTIWGISPGEIKFDINLDSNLSLIIDDTIEEFSESYKTDDFDYDPDPDAIAQDIYENYPDEIEVTIDSSLEDCVSYALSQSSKNIELGESKEKIFRKVFKESHS